MEEKRSRGQQGQSIIIVAIALLALLIFAAIAVDIGNAYVHRRTDQNAADAAALAGARELARQLNECSANPDCETEGEFPNFFLYSNETLILEEMNDFAERNGLEDTDGVAGNAVNTNVVGYYLTEEGVHASENVIGSMDFVHPDARGVEAFAYSVAPSFFSGVLGLDGLSIQAESAVVFGGACSGICVMPIAAYTETFLYDECYNIYDGDHPGSFGWLNWQFSRGDDTCKCSAVCTERNLDPLTCNSGLLRVGEYVASDSGLANTKDIRNQLKCYAGLTPLDPGGSVNCTHIGEPEPFTIIIYDETACYGGFCDECAKVAPAGNRGFAYRIAGFAKFQLLGFSLATGDGSGQSYGHDGEGCLGPEPTGGNRMTGRFIKWVEGEGGDCGAYGTLIAPRVVK
jgi:hypothetical protein